MSIFRQLLKAKIHRATVTGADLNYEGSLTIPPDLMDLADICEYEAVEVWNISNGNRFQTYAIQGLDGSRDICVNGAAAHLAQPGDRIIIGCFMYFDQESLAEYEPRIVFVDEDNQVVSTRGEVPGPQVMMGC